MKAQWLSKHFGWKAGAGAALLTATAATAATYAILPYQIDEIVKSAPEAAPTYTQKKIPVAPKLVKPKSASLFVHIDSSPAAGYEIYSDVFCKEYADQCGGQGRASAVLYNNDTLGLLTSVNAGVNKSVEYKTDKELFGVTGKFAIPGSRDGGPLQGDCEDHALLKREILSGHGVPRETMMIALVSIVETQADHAVLIVRTTGGDYVLDNRHDDIQRVKDVIDNKEYKFLFMSRPENDRILSSVLDVDDTNDTAALNTYGVWPSAIKGDVPTAEDVQQALAPKPASPRPEQIMVAQAPPVATEAAPVPTL